MAIQSIGRITLPFRLPLIPFANIFYNRVLGLTRINVLEDLFSLPPFPLQWLSE
jgi:hypothetical protein